MREGSSWSNAKNGNTCAVYEDCSAKIPKISSSAVGEQICCQSKIVPIIVPQCIATAPSLSLRSRLGTVKLSQSKAKTDNGFSPLLQILP